MNILKLIKDNNQDNVIDIAKTTAIVWNEIDNIIKDDFNLLGTAINSVTEKSKANQEEFLSKNINTKLKDYIFDLVEFYGKLHFFPNEPVLSKFTQLGLKKSELKFFIHINEIIDAINAVNKSESVRLKYNSTLKLLATHFKLKIINTMQLHLNMSGSKKSGTIYNEAHNALFDFYRRQDYYQKVGSSPNDEFSIEMRRILSSVEIYGEPAEVSRKKMLLNAQGKTEKDILRELLNECTFHKCSESEFYITLFAFFKLIMPDSALLSEDEFYENDFSSSYNADYKRYKYLKLKSIIKSTSI